MLKQCTTMRMVPEAASLALLKPLSPHPFRLVSFLKVLTAPQAPISRRPDRVLEDAALNKCASPLSIGSALIVNVLAASTLSEIFSGI